MCCVSRCMYVCIATRSVPCLLVVLTTIITVTVTHRILAIPPSHCASTYYNTTSDFDSPTLIHIQPNNLVIATCYLLLASYTHNTSQQTQQHLSILLGSINDHINPRHRLTIPKHQHLQHRNNEEVSSHPINHHPALNQPPTLLQLHLNLHPPIPLALQPPLSKHRRPQHPLPSCFSRSLASPLKHDSQRQSPQHPSARVTNVNHGAQTQLGRLRAPARRLHLVPGL